MLPKDLLFDLFEQRKAEKNTNEFQFILSKIPFVDSNQSFMKIMNTEIRSSEEQESLEWRSRI